MPASRATAFDRLAPDQRAAVELVLRQGRSYGELSDLLGMPEETIRSRARGGLAALAPDLPAPARAGEIADWLLGQQSEAHGKRTRELLLGDPAAHTWAATVAVPLREAPGGDAVPELPTGPDADTARVNGKRRRATAPATDDAAAARSAAAAGDPPAEGRGDRAAATGEVTAARSAAAADDAAAARSTAAADNAAAPRGEATPARGPAASGATAAPDREVPDFGFEDDDAAAPAEPARVREDRGGSSRLGGALLIGAAVVIVAAVIAFVFLSGDDAPDPAADLPAPTQTATPATTAVGTAQFALRGPAGSSAVALGQIFRASDDTVRFAIAGQGIEPNADGERYSIWLTRESGDPLLLGDVNEAVGENGQLTAAGPGNDDTDQFPEWLTTYDSMAITLDEKGAKEPGKVILTGPLPTTGG